LDEIFRNQRRRGGNHAVFDGKSAKNLSFGEEISAFFAQIK
jgi:hypothetical protein